MVPVKKTVFWLFALMNVLLFALITIGQAQQAQPTLTPEAGTTPTIATPAAGATPAAPQAAVATPAQTTMPTSAPSSIPSIVQPNVVTPMGTVSTMDPTVIATPAPIAPAPMVTTMPAPYLDPAMTSPVVSAPGLPSPAFSAAPAGIPSAPAVYQPAPVLPTPAINTSPGLWVNNPTAYPAMITLHIESSDDLSQTDVPAGQNVQIIPTLSNADKYTASGSLFRTVITKTAVTTLSGPMPSATPTEFINTETTRISTAQEWSANHPATPGIQLILNLIETPGVDPILEIRQQ